MSHDQPVKLEALLTLLMNHSLVAAFSHTAHPTFLWAFVHLGSTVP